MKTLKRIFASLMVAVMMLTASPLSEFADLDLSDCFALNTKASAATYGVYVYEVNEDGNTATITDCSDDVAGDIEIPSIINGYKVTIIGEGAFVCCDSLTSIKIPDSVTSIGGAAFMGCEKIESIAIGSGVTFMDTDNWFFGSCYNLSRITVDDANTVYSSDKYGVLFNENKTRLIQYPVGNSRKGYTIPDSVTDIRDFAFAYDYNLTSIIIPDSVETIGYRAFSDCNALKNILIPKSVWYIDELAFQGCNSLTSIIVDEKNTVYSNDEYGVLFNKNKTELIQYPIGNSRTSYVIPNGVESLNICAFQYCEGITSITIPKSVASIGDSIFDGVSVNLTDVYYAGSEEEWNNISIGSNNDNLLNATIHFNSTDNENTEELVEYTEGLFSYVIENSEVKITNCAKSANGDISIPLTFGGYPVKKIGANAFSDCYDINSISMPDSVVVIESEAFLNCTNMTSIKFSNSLEEIPRRTFFNCGKLKEAYIPDSVKTIGNDAFVYCGSLKVLSLGDNLVNIGMSAFSDCDSLVTVEIGIGLEKVAMGAFYSCDSLSDVYYAGSYEQWKNISVGSLNSELLNATIHFNSSLPEKNILKLNMDSYSTNNNSGPWIQVVQYPIGYDESDIVWTSSNENVAIVTDSGTTQPVSYGKTYITATTSDGLYSACCELTVLSAFVVTSSTTSGRMLQVGLTEKFSVFLLDSEGKKMSTKNVDISGLNELNNIEITNLVKGDKCITFDAKGLSQGYDKLSFADDKSWTFNEYTFGVYPENIDYIADEVPNVDKQSEINFVRSDMIVEDFKYVYNESTRKYDVTMTVYNDSGAAGALVAYNTKGEIVDKDMVESHDGMATDWEGFIGALGKGVLAIAGGALMNNIHKNPVYYTKTEVSVSVPEDGYITLSNDIRYCPVASIYNISSIVIESAITTIKLAQDFSDLGKSKELSKSLVKKLLEGVPDGDKFLKGLLKSTTKEIISSSAPEVVLANTEYSIEFIDDLCRNAGSSLEETLNEVFWESLRVTVRDMVTKGALVKMARKKILTTASAGLLEAAGAIFTAGDVLNLINKIVCATSLNVGDGATTIQFKSCGKDGFICKDVVKVISDEFVDDMLLQHFVLYDEKSLLKKKQDLVLKEDDIIEVHEMSVFSNGEKVDIKTTVTVEIDYNLPKGYPPSSIKVLRAEADGTYTNMNAYYDSVNKKIIFKTDHFSEYIIVLESPSVNSVSIDNISLNYKDSTTITPVINADAGVNYTVSYSSSNDSVVSVDSNGRLTTNDKGSATITVTVTDEYGNTVSDTCNVEVKYNWWQWIIVIVLFGWIWY